MKDDVFAQILDEHKELSSLPQTLAEILKLSRDPDSSAKDLSQALLRDPALTAKVLRLANSPYFGAGREISSATQAVMTLGIRAVTALSLSASVYNLTSKWQNAIDRMRFWRHSLCVAVGARTIAEAVKYERPEEAFVAGLLHDLGLLVLEKAFPDKFARLWQKAESGERIDRLEESVWGTNHARVGQFLLEQWNIPEAICIAVGSHHLEVVQGATDKSQQLAQIIALANQRAHFTVKAKRPYPSSIDEVEILCGNLGIDETSLTDILDQLLSETIEEAKFLEMDIGSTHDLLMEANRMLYSQFLQVEKLLRENGAMKERVAQAEQEKRALETLKAITATLNHYINNAIGTILGRAQLVQINIEKSDNAIDPDGSVAQSMAVIVSSVNTIQSVVEELSNLTSFDTKIYHDDTYIIDIENRLRSQMAGTEKLKPASS